MQYLIVGDLHLKPSNIEIVKDLFNLIEETGLPTIWLGDLLDTKEIIRGKCLNTLLEYINYSKLNHTFLVGNHDYFNLDCEDHSLKSLDLFENVQVIDAPIKLTKESEIAFMPYFHNPNDFIEHLKSDKFKNVKTVFAHQGFSGFDYGNGFIAEKETDLKKCPKSIQIISGHFHKYQKSKNLTYLGTPFSHSFGESNQEKFLGVFDTETHEMKLLTITEKFPNYVTLEVDLKNTTTEKANKLIKKWIKSNSDNFKRVDIRGDEENIKNIDKTLLRGVKLRTFIENTDSKDTKIQESASNVDQFKTWAKDVRNLPKRTTEIGLSILKAVSSK